MLKEKLKAWLRESLADVPACDVHVIEISGICNARCPVCPTGSSADRRAGFMKPELFEKIILHQEEVGLLREGQPLQLYIYGEPFLNPRVNEILDLTGRHGLKAAFGSNFIKRPMINPEQFRNISAVVLSICGLTEDRYRGVYGADVGRVLENFDRFLEEKDRYNKDMLVIVNWLRYRPIDSQLEEARVYFEKRGCTFRPIVAFINDIPKMIMLYEDTLSAGQRSVAKNMIDLEYVFGRMEHLREKYPDYKCPQDDGIVISETGRLRGCCVIGRGHQDSDLGDILSMKSSEIFRRKKMLISCQKCKEYGVAQLCHIGFLDD